MFLLPFFSFPFHFIKKKNLSLFFLRVLGTEEETKEIRRRRCLYLCTYVCTYVRLARRLRDRGQGQGEEK